MPHMVIFRSGEGKAGYHQADALEDAIRFVERLRNSENVEQARIFRMEEVLFEYRPYFRVEVGGASPAPEAGHLPGAVAMSAPVEQHLLEPMPEDHDDDELAVGAKRGLFSR